MYSITNSKKKGARPGMNLEEIRINKQLLHKISKFKKENGYSNQAKDARCMSQESDPQFN